MSSAREQTEHFLEHERAFRLGALLTESSHPKTATLSQTTERSVPDGIRMLATVDEEIAPAARNVLAGEAFRKLAAAIVGALDSGRRIYLTGCGATGRLSILLEAAWRKFWQTLASRHPHKRAKLPDLEDRVVSVMAGGDYALIRSVEGFEDFPRFGKHHLGSVGVAEGDVVVAITEGGETPFVIGTAWKGLDVDARVFFVYNNPTEILRRHVERSRELIDDDRVTCLDLTTGPMSVAGSTRMQATTSELLVVGAALETALQEILRKHLSPDEAAAMEFPCMEPGEYADTMAGLVSQLAEPEAIDALARLTQFEQSVYRPGGLVTYAADAFLLDVLTDTTERSPTFRLPPFRMFDDTVSARSWAFVKNPRCDTQETWFEVFRRQPRGLDWDAETYRRLNAPQKLQADPPRLGSHQIYGFQIGNEPDPSRCEAADSAWIMIPVGGEARDWTEAEHPFRRGFERLAADFHRTAAVCVGPESLDRDVVDEVFHVPVGLPPSPLELWHHLAVKLALNTVSTATMALMGRVLGNWMVHVETTNKKLIDRGTRIIAELTGLSYEEACLRLHETIEEVQPREQQTKDAPSPVALAIERITRSTQ